MQHNDIKMRTDISQNAILVKMLIAGKKALDDYPIVDFVEGEGYYISDTLIEVRSREWKIAQIEAFCGKSVYDIILSIQDTKEIESFINGAMYEIGEFRKKQPKENLIKAEEIANKLYKLHYERKDENV